MVYRVGCTAEDGPFRVANSDKEFLIDWTTANHTAEDIPVTAMGPGGEDLVGTYENTHIHDAMVQALGLPDAAPAPMPETGGPAAPSWTVAPVALLAGLVGAGLLFYERASRGASREEG